MSSQGDDRWRGGPNRQSSQRHSGNTNRDRNTGGQGDSRGGNAARSGGPGQEQHVPVRGFNAAETRNILKRGPKEPKAPFYKPTGKDASNQRSGGPWGSKSNIMANGKDFFIELRKQVASLQRSRSPMGG